MSVTPKYLRRIDTKVVQRLEPALIELLRQHLDQAGLPYEVLDAPPEPDNAGEDQPTKRRRSS